ncbi:MAG TPA: hypothetical protein VJ992_16120 [Gemmatimonadales bacterium]|nr:hypothetical protein [Gemmatimonadales bacterium]
MFRFLRRLFGRGKRPVTPQAEAPAVAQRVTPHARPASRAPSPSPSEGVEGAPITGAGGSVVVRLWRAGPFVVLGTSAAAAAEAFATLSHHPDAGVRNEAERALARWPEGEAIERRAPAAPSGGPAHSRGSRRSAAELMQ